MVKREKAVLTISKTGFMTLLGICDGLPLSDIRSHTKQTYQQQQHSLKNLIDSDSIEKESRGKYLPTEFGRYIAEKLRGRVNGGKA